MPTIGEKKYRDNTSTFIDDARNYKRKSIDEHDECSFVEDLLYLNQEERFAEHATFATFATFAKCAKCAKR